MEEWLYSDVVKDHFMNPKNVLMEDESSWECDGRGIVGSIKCGDQMLILIRIKDDIQKQRFSVFFPAILGRTVQYAIFSPQKTGRSAYVLLIHFAALVCQCPVLHIQSKTTQFPTFSLLSVTKQPKALFCFANGGIHKALAVDQNGV